MSGAQSDRSDAVGLARLFDEAWRYQVDAWQRSVLFWDTLRERANGMLAHERAGLPPVLAFEYETVLDARQFSRPANYALLRIVPPPDCAEACANGAKRPVIVIDPRAGHGPGIGGAKRDSEVGIALHEGHPVYFVSFFPEPCPGQTLADVLHALRRFVEEVTRRHPERGAPVLYGNCQAGWAVTLLSADCAGLAGPAVLNGSPLSYRAGAPGVNTMRLLGGLAGGTWLAEWLADLGDGALDGAWLVQNFEHLNPVAVWEKYAGLLARVDEERERFLDFERWWGGFYGLSRQEIVAIVEHLFVGNKLERGELRLCEGCVVDLRRVRNPLVVFASYGDAITPPHQALGWIPAVYASTEALKSAGQRIAYLTNPHVGHLGIFVSAKVARLEHRAILESVEALEALGPGLYEMKIVNPTGDPDCRRPQYEVTFEPRRVENLKFDHPREAFERVRAVSEANQALYRNFVSPWVRALSTPWSAAMFRWLHPMRVTRYAFADGLNPWAPALAALAERVRADRRPADPDNRFLALERAAAALVSAGLEAWRVSRDRIFEAAFATIYG